MINCLLSWNISESQLHLLIYSPPTSLRFCPQNLNQNPRTLLPKFYGLYCIQTSGKNIRIVVMNNLLPRSVKMHVKYDLKGSTYKRRASQKEREKAFPTFKDLDFLQDMPDGLLLDPDMYNALCKTLQRDCLVLQSFKIMDYSLLVAIHNIEYAQREPLPPEAGSGTEPRKPASQKALYSTAMESIQGEARRGGTIETEDQLGGIPAQNSKGERLLLYIGIIDILQSYRFMKKLEHSWKALVHDGDTVSVHRPSFYAERFHRFMCHTVFRKIALKPSPSKKSRMSSSLRRVGPSGNSFSLPQVIVPISGDSKIEMTTQVEVEPGVLFRRPDLLPQTPPVDEINNDTADAAATRSTSKVSVKIDTISANRLTDISSMQVDHRLESNEELLKRTRTLSLVGSPSSVRIDVDSERIDVNSERIDVDLERIDVDSERIDASSVRVDVASERIDADSERVDVASERIDGSSERVDASSEKVDVASERVDASSEGVDVASERIDVDSKRIDATAESEVNYISSQFQDRNLDAEHLRTSSNETTEGRSADSS